MSDDPLLLIAVGVVAALGISAFFCARLFDESSNQPQKQEGSNIVIPAGGDAACGGGCGGGGCGGG